VLGFTEFYYVSCFSTHLMKSWLFIDLTLDLTFDFTRSSWVSPSWNRCRIQLNSASIAFIKPNQFSNKLYSFIRNRESLLRNIGNPLMVFPVFIETAVEIGEECS